MTKTVVRHCDPCGGVIPADRPGSILAVRAGDLVGKLPEEPDLCSLCGSLLLSWFESRVEDASRYYVGTQVAH